MDNPYWPYPVRVDQVITETEDEKLKSFKLVFLSPEDEKKFKYLPGQFAELSIPGKGEIPIGIASSPTEKHLEVLEWAPPEVVIDVHCSSGTYVRSLANDLGEKLGCGAYLVGLRRTKSGRFSLRDAVPLRKLQEAFHAGNWYQYLIPAAEALGDWPALELSPDDC